MATAASSPAARSTASSVKDGERADEIEAQHVIIATGSVARALPGAPFDNERILDNVGALALSRDPQAARAWSAQA